MVSTFVRYYRFFNNCIHIAEFENWVQGARRDRARSRKTTPPTHIYAGKPFVRQVLKAATVLITMFRGCNTIMVALQ